MPGGDRTGPRGQGTFTGHGPGRSSTDEWSGGDAAPTPGWGRGRGGRGRRQRGVGVGYFGRNNVPRGIRFFESSERQYEEDRLKEETRALESRLNQLTELIEEMESDPEHGN